MNALGNDARGQHHEQPHEQDVAQKAEIHQPARGRIHAQNLGHRGAEVGNHPAGDDSVKTQDHRDREYPGQAHERAGATGFGAPGDKPQGGHCVGMGMASDNEFGHKRRVGQQEGQHQVHQQEGCTPVAGGLGREAPDVPQPHCAARRGHDEADSPRGDAAILLFLNDFFGKNTSFYMNSFTSST